MDTAHGRSGNLDDLDGDVTDLTDVTGKNTWIQESCEFGSRSQGCYMMLTTCVPYLDFGSTD